MFKHLTLRNKLIAIVTPPLGILAIVAAYSVMLGSGDSSTFQQLASDIRTLGVVSLAALLLSVLTVLVIGRTITDPLAELSDAADELANVRLPQLVEALRNPGSTPPAFEPMHIATTNDEIGRLLRSLNAVQDSAAEVAEQQRSLVHAGVSDLVINLARRNQSLIDRQIENIDALESNEEDPDRLEELFALDHLATRMRRNAESLLVVAGAEPPRRRGAPVEITDVLRVAMSEIEDYNRVRLLSVDEALVGNQSAVDLAHLLSELLENAAGFSPPNTSVEVKGIQEPDGYYLISVTDFGIGMSEEQLSAANIILANPPELGLGLSRSLGFIVVGRLARRLGVRVELTRGTTSMGVTALVLVPASVLAGDHPTATPVGASPAPVTPAPLEPLAYESFVHESAAHESAAHESAVHESAPIEPLAFESFVHELPVHESVVHESPVHEPAAHQSHVHAVPPALQGPPSRPVASPFADPIPPAPSFEATTSFEPGFFGTPALDAPPPPSEAPMPPGFDDPAIDAPWPPKPAIEPATPIEYQSEALAELLGKAPTPRPSHTSRDTPDSFTPASLAQAIPDGDQFEAGVAALLQPGHPASYRPAPPSTTDSGLVKRDRSRSQAPPSEGRPVAPSVRSPEEIRQMLARYRDGRSRPLDGADGSRPSDRAVSPDPFNPGGHE